MNIVITGGTKGIGLSIAQTFAAQGFNLAIAARTAADLERLQASFKEQFPEVSVITCATDLSCRAGVEDFAGVIQQHWKAVHVLVNNAGLFLPGALLEEPDDHLSRMMDTNLFAPYYLTRALVPHLHAAGPSHIFNICSVASLQAYPGRSSYGISKFALRGLTEALRVELRNKNIKVTAVFPGATWTYSWEGSGVPLESLVRAEDVAKAIYSAYDTGPCSVVEEIVIRPSSGDQPLLQ